MTDLPPPPPGAPTPAPAPAPAGKPWWKRKGWWAVGVIVVLIAVAVATQDSKDDDNEAVKATATTIQTPASSTTATGPATSSATTHTTEAATTTIAATTTAVAATTTAAPPQPIHYEGSGDSVIQNVAMPSWPAILAATHDGKRNFIVNTLDADLKEADYLVNTIGTYSGTVPLSFGTYGHKPAGFEIQADGAWTLDIEPLIGSARVFTGSITGHGDEVLYSTVGHAAVAHMTHNGERNFIVTSYENTNNDTFGDGLVNEIGAYDGQVRMPKGAAIEIQADGDWTINLT